MDTKLACHAIALEAAKSYVNANLPEYLNSSGIEGFTKDMAQQYIDAYKVAEKVFRDPKNIPKARVINSPL